jgi:hypothetical protein
MTRIFSISIVVAIFVGCSLGQKCRNRGNETHLRIEYCDRDSWKQLVRSLEARNIIQLKAGSDQNKNFQTIDAEMFKDMSNLVQLELSECGIKNIAEDSFSRLNSLKVLDLSDNSIKQLNERVFWSLEDLDELNLHYNQIEEMSVKLLQNNRKLKELWINSNKIKSIPFGLLGSLTELESFSIADNMLKVIHPNTFQQNKKLKFVFLNANDFGAIFGGTFGGLPNLARLDLTRNRCIDKDYGKWDSELAINLDSLSSDLAVCARNYDNILKGLTKKLKNDYNVATPKRTIILKQHSKLE